MSRSTVVYAVLAAAVLPVVSRQARGAELFRDNFEITANGGNDVENGNDTFTGTPPQTLPLHADVGSYVTLDTNGRISPYSVTGNLVTLQNPTVAGAVNNTTPLNTAISILGPEVTGGSHALRLQGPTNPPPGTGNSGGRIAGVLAQTANQFGSTFRMDFDIYASSSVSFGFGSQVQKEFGIRSGISSTAVANTRPGQSFLVNLASGLVTVTADTDNNPSTANSTAPGFSTGLTFTTNTFQHFALEYVIGSTTVKIIQTKSVSGTPTTFTKEVGVPADAISPFLSAIDFDYMGGNGNTNPFAVTSLSQVDTIFFSTGTAGAVGFVDNLVVTGTHQTGIRGDANSDNFVNALDFNALATNFGTVSGATLPMGDFSGDGAVSTIDFNIVATYFNTSAPAPAALGSVVPEPAAAGVLCLAAGLLGRFPRRARPLRAVPLRD